LSREVDGVKYNVAPDDVQVERTTGDIVRCRSRIIGRPCFGIIPAFLRESDRRTYFHVPTGRTRETRCGLCPLYDACRKVCMTRIRALPDVHDAYKGFMVAGGPHALRKKRECGHYLARAAFDRIVRLVIQHVKRGGFKSINDDVVLEYYTDRARKRNQLDAEYQCNKRKADNFAGVIDGALADQLQWHRDGRHKILLILLAKGILTKFGIKQMTPQSCARIADAWYAKTILAIKGGDVTPSFPPAGIRAEWLFCASARLKQWAA